MKLERARSKIYSEIRHSEQKELFFLSFFLYVLTTVEDIRRDSVYKCKVGVSGIKEVNS